MRILIATDGSDASRSVIETACRTIANPDNTTVKIISAVEPLAPLTAEPFPVSAQYYGEIEAQASKNAEELTAQAAARLQEICPNIGDVSSEVFRSISAAQAIVEAAKNWAADLIVVGSHGRGFWSRALLGSVSNSVAHHAPCSMMIVRGKQAAKS